MKDCGSTKIHEKWITTLGDDADALSHIKFWLEKLRNGDSSCRALSRSRATTLDCEAAAWDVSTKLFFCQRPGNYWPFSYNHPYDSRRPLERELGMKQRALRWAPFPQSRSKTCSYWSIEKDVANFTRIQSKSFWWNRNGWRVLVSIFLSALQNVCTTANKGHFQDAKAITADQIMVPVFFTAWKLIVPGVLPKGSKFN
jgi:hypothetical protein